MGAGVGVIDADGALPFLPLSFVVSPLSSSYLEVATILFTSNLIGICFSRSLHYQFYSWYAQQVPFLLFHTPYPVWTRLLLMAVIEYGWNVFPSTNLSSAVLVCGNAFLLIGLWFGPTPTGEDADQKVKTS